MLAFAEDAVGYAAGRSLDDLRTDKDLRYLLTYTILWTGEAASRVPSEIADSYPAIPWRDIVGMRNRLVHGYDSISLERLWVVATSDLPPLIENLHAILEQERES